MAILPNITGNLPPLNYQVQNYIESTGTQYIDAVVNPASSYNRNLLKIEADMSFTSVPTGSSTQSYLFGTGYYNSTAGNRRNILAGYRGGTSTSLFSYLNGGQLSNAAAFTGATLDTNEHVFTIDQVNSQYGFDSSTQSFTGTISTNLTATLKIFCAHQSGTSGNPIGYYSSARLYKFHVYQNGTIYREFFPVKRISDGEYGLYDVVNQEFYTNQGTGDFIGAVSYPVYLYASPTNGGTVSGEGTYDEGTQITISATPYDRYTFAGWSDGDTTNPRTLTVTGYTKLTAMFLKTKTVLGPEYRLWAKKRTQFNTEPTFFTNVLSADINEDLLQKTTTTIMCEDDCSYLGTGDIVAVRDGKNNAVFTGVVSTVEGKKITCSQLQNLYGYDFYAQIDTASDKSTYPTYRESTMLGRYISRLSNGYMASGSVDLNYPLTYILGNLQLKVSAVDDATVNPVIPYREKNETVNVESLIYNAFSQYGLLTKIDILFEASVTPITIYFFNPAEGFHTGGIFLFSPYPVIDISDNAEFISNINVVTETEAVNCLYIFDSTGTTFREGYAVLNNGTFITLPDSLPSLPYRYLPVKPKFVSSDENLTAIRDAELKLLQYNHKVSFTFDLQNNFYDFGDLMLGQNINFYVDDRLYNSVLTGWSFHIENGTELKQVDLICGKVRNNLTSKLNMGKVK